MVQKKVTMITILVILIFCITATISTFAFHDHHNRKVFIGIIGLIASIAILLSHVLLIMSPNLVGSPLGIVQLVLYFKYRKRTIINDQPNGI
ncbi:Bidirectional sugar transporter SWEET3 [Camellia lanceoleosa]|uniref:Bidirectional sugar transporter SWEET3 n=1 Tax=Camellia lanceoleosa TaxID=1840588 RepID=A0ACC0J2H7_9ERIC|nr:Bidirectional sugar transporter SWEET3 [Camellia lanceoleosa]